MAEAVIDFSGVSKNYGAVKAVDAMSFTVERGDMVGFLGPNGSGKTTTIRLMNGVIFPDAGQIRVNGLNTVKQGDLIRRRTGVLTETANLYEHMTVAENLSFFAELYNVPTAAARTRVAGLIERFDLGEKQGQKVAALSTGLKKRVALAKALIHEPEILFLDEPTSGLDPEAARDIIGLLRALNDSGVTVFVCTHNLREAEHFCRRFVFLDRGRILESGALGDIEKKYTAPTDVRIEFTGELPEKALSDRPRETDPRGGVVFHLSSRLQIPELVRELAAAGANIFDVSALNSNLESLYFEIRGKSDERKDH